ncbi:MAG: hypothetical protein H6898_08410 [Rhodobacter sp.]|nr:hypothetical protein [Paracoccaceae bacterium]MCC0076596.1 hypothetical protein [Rhodobacter sp.]
MLVIDKKIVIAHMKKCGGTSVCKGLIETLEPGRVEYWGYTEEGEKRSAVSRRRGGLWKHSPVRDIVTKLPYDRKDLTIYLISLRPWWDRTGSFYFHAKRYNRLSKKYKWVEGMSFSEFLRNENFTEIEPLDHFCNDENGQSAVDYFVDYDSLDDWYARLMAELGHAGVTLPKYNVGAKKKDGGYRAYYSEEDFEFTAKAFAGETEMIARMTPAAPGLFRLP